MKKILSNLFFKKKNIFIPDWKKINNYPIKGKPRILIATSAGCLDFNTKFETLLAKALVNEGSNVEFFLCDQELEICLGTTTHDFKNHEDFLKDKNKKHYDKCFENGFQYLKKAGLNINIFSDYLEKQKVLIDFRKIIKKYKLQKIEKLKYKNFNLGENAKSGALRYLAKGQFKESDRKILEAYLLATMKTYNVMKNLFKKKKFDIIVLNHGIYVPQGAIVDFAQKNKINSISWCASYKKNSFTFSKKDTYHKSLLEEPNSNWEKIKLNKLKKKKIKEYLKSRSIGSNDWIYFHNKRPDFDIKNFFKENNIDEKKPIITLLTNVVWDAQLHFDKTIFNNMNEWVFHAINFFKRKKNQQLIIRAHPAEISGNIPSKELIGDLIKDKFNKLPDNVKFIGPENKISTYPLCEKSSSIIIYGTKMGFELAPLGIPILVAGESWVKNKRISFDPKDKKEYENLLENIYKKKISNKVKERALKYAYHYFFRRSIPISLIKNDNSRSSNFHFSKDTIKKIKNRKDPGLKVIVESIIKNKDFIYN